MLRQVSLVVCLAVSAQCAGVIAAEKVSRRGSIKQATVWLDAALKAEATGDLSKRSQLLEQAASIAPLNEAKWHLGMVRDESGNWLDVAAAADLQKDDKLLAKYEQLRDNARSTVEEQLQLATWCVRNGLMEQARSHFHQVILIDRDHLVARRALGYVRIGNDWVSNEDVAKYQERWATSHASFKKHKSAIARIVLDLNGKNERVKEAALKKQDDLCTAEVVPAIEAYFSMVPEQASIGVDWLAKIDCVESTVSLAKFALMHPDPLLRDRAIEHLKLRPLHDYVPELLAMLATQISSTLIPKFDENGELIGYTQALTQERFDEKELMAIDTRVQTNGRNSRGQAFLEEQMELAINPLTSGEAELQQQFSREDIDRENNMLRQRNERIGALVSTVGNFEFNGNVKELWNWWDEYNETDYQSYKTERSSYSQQTIAYSDPTDTPVGECFVKGTPVMTNRGLKSIETIVAGDLVLSRDVRSGELDWKPVLRATKRPPETTRIIKFADDQVQCTTGHLLWVSGKGWRKASEVVVGDVLHCAKEPVVVDSITDAQKLETFNLDVADFGTYFAGASMVLSHDVKPRSAERNTVPGLNFISTKRP